MSTTILFDTAQMGGNTVAHAQGPLELQPGTGTTMIDSGGQVAVSGGGTSSVFQVDAGTQAVLTGLTIEDGYSSSTGGGISNAGTLVMTVDTLTGNAGMFGGGVSNYLGAVTAVDCTFTNNSSPQAGGGIDNDGGIVAVEGCTFSTNAASRSAAASTTSRAR